jgi:hypothetical protein
MNIISENTETTLKNKGWENVAPKGFFINIYRDEMEFNVWEDYCSQVDKNIDPHEVDKLILLCIAHTEE